MDSIIPTGRSSSVAPLSDEIHYNVHFNKRSIFMSFIMFVNVAIMPLKAYISEPFPWAPMEPTTFLVECTPNVTACMPCVFEFFANKSRTMSKHQTHAGSDDWDIYRFVLPPLPPKDDDPNTYLLKLPYAIFYTPFERQQVIHLVKREINISDFRSIQADRFFSIVFNYAMIWTESNDTINVGFLRATTTRGWLSFKLTYRCCFCIYIMVRMWRQYYQHYYHLAANLRQFGIDTAAKSDRIEIIVGDPTSIILLNPYVSLVFVLDVWVSIEFINRAIVRVNQVSDIGLFAVACFYLSRTLWFAYGGLIGVSYLLKKFNKEKSFDEADPTLTAMAVVIAAGPLTYLQSTIAAFVDMYYYLFLALSKDENSHEIALSAIAYSFIIATLPINFGFISKYFSRCRKYRISQNMTYGSFTMNDIKHRLTHCFNLMSLSEPAAIIQGGSMYRLFSQDRKFKRNLGMSQRGADCYLLFGTGKRRTSVRLSLLSCIDPCHHIPTINKNAPVGRLYFENGEVHLVHGTYNSPWIA